MYWKCSQGSSAVRIVRMLLWLRCCNHLPPSVPFFFFLHIFLLTSSHLFDVCVCHWSCIAPVACHRHMCILGARLYRLRSLHCGQCAAEFVCTLFLGISGCGAGRWGVQFEVDAVWHISHLPFAVITATVVEPSLHFVRVERVGSGLSAEFPLCGRRLLLSKSQNVSCLLDYIPF